MKKVVFVAYLVLAYFASFFIISNALSLIGIPMAIDKEVVLHPGETFDRLFLLSDVSNSSAVFYTVNNGQEYALTPGLTITVDPSSDFDGSIYVDQISEKNVKLRFDLHRAQNDNVVIGIVSIFLVIPFYLLYKKLSTYLHIKKSIGMPRVNKLLEQIGLTGEIEKRPMKLETVMNLFLQGAGTLPRGQLQRPVIYRAMYAEPSVLLLDD